MALHHLNSEFGLEINNFLLLLLQIGPDHLFSSVELPLRALCVHLGITAARGQEHIRLVFVDDHQV